jgi:hypothetical protein
MRPCMHLHAAVWMQVKGVPLRELHETVGRVEWLPVSHIYDTARDVSGAWAAVQWDVLGSGEAAADAFLGRDPLQGPVAAVSGADPVRSVLRITPRAGTECSYTLCFAVAAPGGGSALWQHPKGSLEMNCAAAQPDVRCFTVHIADMAAQLDGAAIEVDMTAPLVATPIGDAADARACGDAPVAFGGMAWSAWVYPTEACGTLMPVVTACTRADPGMPAAPLQQFALRQSCASLRWRAEVAWGPLGTVAASAYALEPHAWHHLRIEMSANGSAYNVALYADEGAHSMHAQHASVPAAAAAVPAADVPTVQAAARPDGFAAGLVLGSFAGAPFRGLLADVAVYNATFRGAFAVAAEFDSLPVSQRAALMAYWRLSDGRRNAAAAAGIGNAHLRAPPAPRAGAGGAAAAPPPAFLQYP